MNITQLVLLLKTNIKSLLILFIIAILITISYYYSYSVRVKNIIRKLDNHYTYKNPRIQYEFCGLNSNRNSKFITNVELNPKNNELKIKNKNINLYDLNLSSEFLININNSHNNVYDNPPNKYYKIKKITNDNSIILSNQDSHKILDISEDIKKNNFNKELEITFFKPQVNKNKYNYIKLCDYNISSSYNSFLIGNNIFDYCSLDMIKKTLYMGARYLEFEIYDNNHDKPIIYHGNNMQLTLNNLFLEEVLKLISKFAFSNRFIDNFKDPLFIYLNLKTDNIKTLENIAKLIRQYLSLYILDKRYNNINIANLTLCDLQQKIVILTSKSNTQTSLDELINCSSDKPYLQRITYTEALKNVETSNKPILEHTSSNIQFINNKISIGGVNLNNFDIIEGDGLYISGSKYNNTGEYLYNIKTITKKSISIESNFIKEDKGNNITIKIFSKQPKENLEEYNKNNITIVIPDDNYFCNNTNYKNILYKGCQFICMHFQTADTYMDNYFNYFIKSSFIEKPSSLRNPIDIPKTVSLNSMVPKVQEEIILDIDYQFLDNIGRKGTIKSNKSNDTKLINDNRVANLSLNFSFKNSIFIIEKGLNNQDGYISIKDFNNDRYLTYNDSCCYLYFTKAPDESNTKIEQHTFNKFASFLPLNPLINKKNTNTLAVLKTVNNKPSLSYIKVRNNFNINNKLYSKFVKSYIVKLILPKNNETDEQIVIMRPKFNRNKGFFPAGDIAVRLSELDYYKNPKSDVAIDTEVTTEANLLVTKQDKIKKEDNPIIKSIQNFETPLFSGAVTKPINYELVWDNKDLLEIYDNKKLSIWKPIPPSGYLAMGVLFINSFAKPNLNDVVCISNDYLNQEDLTTTNNNQGNPIWYHDDSSLILWDIPKHKYVKPDIFINRNRNKVYVPSSIDFKMYSFILNEKDYLSRLYLDNEIATKQEKEQTLFKFNFNEKITQKSNEIYDYLLELENTDGKIVSYTRGETGNKMCMALPQPYWSGFYDDVTQNNSENKENAVINFESCKNRDYFGTNWNFYDDNSIRLEGNKNACLTYNGSEENISKDINDPNNFLFLDECSNDLKNQKFEYTNSNFKVLTEQEDHNACITHTPKDSLRLEECGDKKYTVISKWDGQFFREDTCSKPDAEKKLEKMSTIEDCNDNTYYVIFLGDGIEHKFEEYCSKKEALEVYKENKKKKEFRRGIAIINNGIIIKKKLKASKDLIILNNYVKKFSNEKGKCLDCIYPSKALCVENNIEESKFNHFENNTDKKDLSDYCVNLKNDSSFRCSRQYRQKFINKILPNDFCLSENKEVFIYVYYPDQHNNLIDVSRYDNTKSPKNNVKFMAPIDNLLGEQYDDINYHMFIKGMLTASNDKNKFKIVFDQGNLPNLKAIHLPKFSSDIIPNYTPSYKSIKVGAKVLARLENDDSYDTESIGFSSIKNNMIQKYKGIDIRWMAVVTKKLKNNRLKIMFSINSYESNKEYEFIANKDKNRPFKESNFTRIVNLDEIVLLKKAPLCL